MWSRRLSQEQQAELLNAYSRGDLVVDIARRFGVHHSYPALLARRRKQPTRLHRLNERYKESENETES